MTFLVSIVSLCCILMGGERSRIAAFFACVFCAHWLIAPYLSGGLIYAVPAFLDLLFIRFILEGDDHLMSRLNIASLSIISIAINFSGYVAYMAYYEPVTYNALSRIIIFCQLMVIMGYGGNIGHHRDQLMVLLRSSGRH